jgi:uncharacterized protein YbaR (Trm112 family)
MVNLSPRNTGYHNCPLCKGKLSDRQAKGYTAYCFECRVHFFSYEIREQNRLVEVLR